MALGSLSDSFPAPSTIASLMLVLFCGSDVILPSVSAEFGAAVTSARGKGSGRTCCVHERASKATTIKSCTVFIVNI